MTTLYTIGDIQAAFGFKITGEMITDELGVVPHSVDKRSKFFTAEQFDEQIRPKLLAHIKGAKLTAVSPRATNVGKGASKPATPPAPPAVKGFDEDEDDDL